MADGRIDGQFVIKRGGLTQGIASELGLTNAECKKISGSVWTQVINEFNNQENLSISNNKNDIACAENNFLVHENAVVKFSKECWAKIVGLINQSLGKNIEIEDSQVESKAIETLNNGDVTIENTRKQSLILKNDAIETFENENSKKPTNISKQEIDDAIKYNDPKNANKKGEKIGDYWYDFDEKGQCERIYNNPPSETKNGVKNSFILITYDDNGIVNEFYRYFDEGQIKSDGTRTCGVYNKNGNLTLYYIESDFNDDKTEARTIHIYNDKNELQSIKKYDERNNECSCEEFDENNVLSQNTTTNYIYDSDGNILESEEKVQDFKNNTTKLFIYKYDEKGEIKYSYEKNEEIESVIDDLYKNLATMTQEDWNNYYEKIQQLNIDKNALLENEDVNNLYFVMQYAGKMGKSFLEDIAKTNKELADNIIKHVVDDESLEDENWIHNIDDIKADMKEHPNDYKKLNVDIQRIMHRAWIDKTENHGDDIINFNNEIDEKIEQGGTGNCFLLSGIKAIDSEPKGRKALNKLRQNLLNDDVLITCNGNRKTYKITQEELIKADYLSAGDDDMRVYELAMDKYRRDMAYENSYLPVDCWSGTFADVSNAFFGVDATSQVELDELENEYNNGKIFNFSISEYCGNETQAVMAKNNKNEDVEIPTNHQLRIKNVDNGIVYYTNPWDDSEILHVPIEKLKGIDDLDIEGLDLSKIAQ